MPVASIRKIIALVVLAAIAAPAAAQSTAPVISLTEDLYAAPAELNPVPEQPPSTLFFGEAIALRHDTALIAMPSYPNTPAPVGRVAVLSDSSGAWLRSGTLDPADGEVEDQFGERVALGHDFALVASRRAVYLFRLAGGSWTQIDELPVTSAAPLDGGLAVRDGMAFIGTSRLDQAGAVEVFSIDARDRRSKGRSDTDGALRRVQILTAKDGSVGDSFGAALDVSHGRLLVGAAGNGDGEGAAYVFEERGSRWDQIQKLTAHDGSTAGGFGGSVSIGANILAVGAPNADFVPGGDCGTGTSGAVYVFARRERSWVPQQRIAEASACANFGLQVVVDEKWLAVTTSWSFPLQSAGLFVYARGGGQFASPAATEFFFDSSDVLALEGSVLFVGTPFDRGISQPGMVAVDELLPSGP